MVLTKISNSWKTARGKEIESVHPPFKSIILYGEARASLLKHVTKYVWQKLGKGEDINQIMEQQNFTNVSLQIIGKQTDRSEKLLHGLEENKKM